MDDRDESDLLRRAKAGCRDAFESVLKPHLPTLLAYTRVICGDYHCAQDVVQETALIAYRNLHHLFPEADFATWLRSIARRQALAARRKLARLNLGLIERLIEAAYQDSTPEATASQREALEKCLPHLNGRLAEAIRGHYFQGSKLSDLATNLSMNVNAVKQLLYRARQSLRDCILKRIRAEKLDDTVHL
jgi:RNA polymerase sigma-70 factor, ECF subfamily